MNKILVLTSALLLAAASTAPSVSYADKGKDKGNTQASSKGNDHPSVKGHGVDDSKHDGKHLDKMSKDERRDHVYDDNDRNDRADRHDNRYYAKKRYRNSARYIAPRNYRPARYTVGNRLPAGYYDRNYYVNYNDYRLAAPPQGYQWVRVGNDVYMVQTRDGMVRDIIYSLFY